MYCAGLTKQRGRTLKRRIAKVMIEQGPVEKKSTPPPMLDDARLRQQAIGQKLRQMFDEIVNEPVPDDFLEILKRADDTATDIGSGDE
jgi:hypothetical protein